MPDYDAPEHQEWWAAREAAYRQRPEVQDEIRQLDAGRRKVHEADYARSSRLEERVAARVPGAQQALDEEMVRQALWTDSPYPSARDDPGEWRAFFQHFYGQDWPENAGYEAERHRIDAEAPPDVGGLQAAYYEANDALSHYDWAELAAERAGMTLQEFQDWQRGVGPAVREFLDAHAGRGHAAYFDGDGGVSCETCGDRLPPEPGPDRRSGEPPGALDEALNADGAGPAAGTRPARSAAAGGHVRGPVPVPGGLEWPGTVGEGIEAAGTGPGTASRIAQAARRAAQHVRGSRLRP